jgi:hypothetical protein
MGQKLKAFIDSFSANPLLYWVSTFEQLNISKYGVVRANAMPVRVSKGGWEIYQHEGNRYKSATVLHYIIILIQDYHLHKSIVVKGKVIPVRVIEEYTIKTIKKYNKRTYNNKYIQLYKYIYSMLYKNIFLLWGIVLVFFRGMLVIKVSNVVWAWVCSYHLFFTCW